MTLHQAGQRAQHITNKLFQPYIQVIWSKGGGGGGAENDTKIC